MSKIKISIDDVGCTVGVRGSGKSQLNKKFVELTPRYVVWDPKREYKPGGATIVESLERLRDEIAQGTDKIVVRLGHDQEAFNWMCQAVFETGNRMIYVDEANRVMPNNDIPEGARAVLDDGRHEDVGMFIICRRPADTHKLPFSQAHHIFLFKLRMQHDVKWMKEYVGEAAEKVKFDPDDPSSPEIDQYQFVYYVDKGSIQDVRVEGPI